MRTLRDDPIVAEIRSIRDRYAARFGYGIKAIFENVRSRQETSGLKYVNYSAARPAPAPAVSVFARGVISHLAGWIRKSWP